MKKTLKKALIEIMVSIFVLALDIIYLAVVLLKYGEKLTARLYKHLPFGALIFIVAFLSLINGIITIPIVMKQRKNKNSTSDEEKQE